MALVRDDLTVRRVGASTPGRFHQGLHLARTVQDVAADPDPDERHAGIRQQTEGADGASAVAPHVMEVHGPGQDGIRARVEALPQLHALVLEIGADALAGVEVDLRAVGRHGQLARQLQAAITVQLEQPELDVIPACRQVADGRRCCNRHDQVHRCWALESHLQRDHAAQRPPGHEVEVVDAEGIQRRPLRARHVARVDLRKVRQLARPGRAVARAEQVEADHLESRRVERQPRTDER